MALLRKASSGAGRPAMGRIVYIHSNVGVDDATHACLQLKREKDVLRGIAARNNVLMTDVPAITHLMVAALTHEDICVVHISSHGFREGLVFEAANGVAPHIVSEDTLFAILGSKFSDLIVLSACNSRGLGDAILRRGLAAHVIATTREVDDVAAIHFMRTFYSCLFLGHILSAAFTLASSSAGTEGEFVLLPEFAAHDMALYEVTAAPRERLRRNNLPHVPHTMQDEVVSRPMEQATHALLEDRCVLYVGSEPGVGCSTVALATAHRMLERDFFDGGMAWVPLRPTVERAQDALHAMWSSICTGVEANVMSGASSDMLRTAARSSLALSQADFLLILDDAPWCECCDAEPAATAGTRTCTAGPFCAARLAQDLLTASRHTRILMAVSRPSAGASQTGMTAAQYYSWHGDDEWRRAAAASSASTQPAVELKTLGAHVVHVQRLNPSETCYALRAQVAAAHGEASISSAEEWSWASLLITADGSSPVLTPEDKAVHAYLDSIGAMTRRVSNMVAPPSAASKSGAELRKSYVNLPSILALCGNFRAIVAFALTLAAKPLHAISLREAVAVYTAAVAGPAQIHVGLRPSVAGVKVWAPPRGTSEPAVRGPDVPGKLPPPLPYPVPAALPAATTLLRDGSSGDPQPVLGMPAAMHQPGRMTSSTEPLAMMPPPPSTLPTHWGMAAAPVDARVSIPAWVDMRMDRAAAERALQPFVAANTVGAFLVRGSREGPSKLALSCTTRPSPTAPVCVTHCIIDCAPPGGGIIIETGPQRVKQSYRSFEHFLGSPPADFLTLAVLPSQGRVAAKQQLIDEGSNLYSPVSGGHAAPSFVSPTAAPVSMAAGFATSIPVLPASMAAPISPAVDISRGMAAFAAPPLWQQAGAVAPPPSRPHGVPDTPSPAPATSSITPLPAASRYYS